MSVKGEYPAVVLQWNLSIEDTTELTVLYREVSLQYVF